MRWKNNIHRIERIRRVYQPGHTAPNEVVRAFWICCSTGIGTQLQGRDHSILFPQIHPVVKAVLGDLHGIGLVGLDLANGTASALLDVQRI